MKKQLLNTVRSLLKSLFLVGLVVLLAFSNADGALAARSGGRIGGGSFRAPRSVPAPGRTYQTPGRGYPGGGGIGFPFILPFFGFGGFSGLFGLFAIIAIANLLIRSFRNASESRQEEAYLNPTVAIAQVQVGLLADARQLQEDLDDLAEVANTNTPIGRAQVLQEATLSLLRHPEYWVYGATTAEQTKLQQAETRFNQLSLSQRSKFAEETLSNVDGFKRQANRPLPDGNGNAEVQAPGEYILVTILVGAEGSLQLPQVKGTEDLKQALQTLGGISREQLLAIEVLWTPQAKGDTLTSEDMIAEYPHLKLL